MNDRQKTDRTGGQIVVDQLKAHGVDFAFCVPGESYLAVLDALYDARNRIKTVSCRHDGGAAFMAEAYGKLTGRPGVALVTRGPGACNAAIAVHVAYQDSTPMILLVGQVPRAHAGREAFQEIDYRQMFAGASGGLAKWAAQIDRADRLPDMMARAFSVAVSGRPGPVVLALPEDMLRERAVVADGTPAAISEPYPSASDVARIRDLLAHAERPLVMVGGSTWRTEGCRDIVAFAGANDLPVCCSFRRQDVFDNDHPSYAGYLGLNNDSKLVERVQAADLVLIVGSRLDEPTTQTYKLLAPPLSGQTIVHVHPSAAELGKFVRPDLAIEAGANAMAAALAAMMPVDRARWAEWRKSARADYLASLKPALLDGAVDLGRVMTMLGETLPNDAIVTLDAGNFTAWPQRYRGYRRPGRLLAPVNGAMGYGMPSAVAASLIHPERVVVAFIGDGGMLMSGSELATAIQYGGRPIALVVNNNMYGTIRLHQERSYPGRPIATDLQNPDFAAWGRSFGAHGECVEKTADFPAAFARARASGKAAVIELRTDPDVLTPRFTISGLRAEAGG